MKFSTPNFAFVGNLRALREPGTFTLAEGHILRRASAKEVERIKEVIQEIAAGPRWTSCDLWEWVLLPNAIQQLAEDDWRYFVISFIGANHTIERLRESFQIAPVELEIVFTTADRGIVWQRSHLFHMLEEIELNPGGCLDVGPDDAKEIARLHEILQRHDPSVLDVKQFIQRLSELKGPPRQSSMRFLGYFGVLESLLTHAPRPDDRYDSVTRQVKKKLALLNNRWTRKLEYGPFGGVSHEKIWETMYAYRSILAHGSAPDFKKTLAVLKNSNQTLTLLIQTVKAVVRHALEEPQLIVDLREC